MQIIHRPSSNQHVLMLKDDPVCTVDYSPQRGVIREIDSISNPELIPPRFLRQKSIGADDLSDWWQDRFAPRSRLPRALQRSEEFARLFAASYGMSLTDQYWIKPASEDVTWGSKNFFTNPFTDEIGRDLLGTGMRSKVRQGEDYRSPSFAANGALRKFWRIDPETGVRQLCKSSSIPGVREAENEVAVSCALGELLVEGGFVDYRPELIDGRVWSVCDCFVDENHEYVPVCDLPVDIDLDEDGFHRLLEFAAEQGVDGYEQELGKMLVVDALVANQDRHFGNFGLIRNVDTLRYESGAPIFDCGTSLWCPVSESESFAPFSRNVNTQLELVKDLSWLDAARASRAVRAIERTLRELGVHPIEAARVGELAEHQADMAIAERDSRPFVAKAPKRTAPKPSRLVESPQTPAEERAAVRQQRTTGVRHDTARHRSR